MAKRTRSVWSVKHELVVKSKEATLSAIKVFNDPLIQFKSETYIVLMIIAWMYLLHAYFRSKGIEYRYCRNGAKRRIFDRTKRGNYKYWELEHCLNDDACPLDKNTIHNLRFLIGLRHEIEHQMTKRLDGFLSGRYQACALNYNRYLKSLFGDEHGLDNHISYSIQFLELTHDQVTVTDREIPKNVANYITAYDAGLSHDEYNSERYSFRLLFKKKLVNRPGQADRVIEFIDPKSELAQQIDKEYWVKKEVERPKFRATEVVQAVNNAGFPKFGIHWHTQMWKQEDAKNPGKGYGVKVPGYWYWYEQWVERCIELCRAAGDKHR